MKYKVLFERVIELECDSVEEAQNILSHNPNLKESLMYSDKVIVVNNNGEFTIKNRNG